MKKCLNLYLSNKVDFTAKNFHFLLIFESVFNLDFPVLNGLIIKIKKLYNNYSKGITCCINT